MSLSESPLASAAQPKKLERKAYLLFRQLFMLTIKLRQLFNPPDLSDKCLWKMLKIPWPFTQLCSQQPCLGVGYMQDGPKSEMQPSATPHILLPISYQTMWQHPSSLCNICQRKRIVNHYWESFVTHLSSLLGIGLCHVLNCLNIFMASWWNINLFSIP